MCLSLSACRLTGGSLSCARPFPCSCIWASRRQNCGALGPPLQPLNRGRSFEAGGTPKFRSPGRAQMVSQIFCELAGSWIPSSLMVLAQMRFGSCSLDCTIPMIFLAINSFMGSVPQPRVVAAKSKTLAAFDKPGPAVRISVPRGYGGRRGELAPQP